jgi:tRNA(Arg) A34 adenosine deaminase TadA
LKLPKIEIAIPEWLIERCETFPDVLETAELRMNFAIELARQNVIHGTGGPFGAVIVERDTGNLLAPGINLVVAGSCSVAHAEMVAIMLAQKSVGNFDLGGEGLPACELVSSTEPCAMCLGAVPWSGVRSLVCGSRDEDARAIGFDEGDKPTDWIACLEARGIQVQRDVCRDAATRILNDYVHSGGELYNPRGEDVA